MEDRFLFDFVYDGGYFKYVDEWSNGFGIYRNGIEIARSRMIFGIPYISVLNIRGQFKNEKGEIIKFRFSTPHNLLKKTTTVYFDDVVVHKAKYIS